MRHESYWQVIANLNRHCEPPAPSSIQMLLKGAWQSPGPESIDRIIGPHCTDLILYEYSLQPIANKINATFPDREIATSRVKLLAAQDVDAGLAMTKTNVHPPSNLSSDISPVPNYPVSRLAR